MKKTLISVATIAALCIALSSSAFAQSGNHTSKIASSSKSTKVCNVSGCTKTSSHKHSGKTYAAHNDNDGHNYHGTNHSESDGHNNHASEGSNHH